VARTGSKNGNITSCFLVHAREVVVVRTGSKRPKNNLQLDLARWGRERGRNNEKPTSGSLLHAREVETGRTASKSQRNPPPARCCTRERWKRGERSRNTAKIKIHLRLALACDGLGWERTGSKPPLRLALARENHIGHIGQSIIPSKHSHVAYVAVARQTPYQPLVLLTPKQHPH
jgi:hypothetical protein